jgi:hypothetical protein
MANYTVQCAAWYPDTAWNRYAAPGRLMAGVVAVGSCNVSCYQFIMDGYQNTAGSVNGTMIPISGIHFKCLLRNCIKSVMKK